MAPDRYWLRFKLETLTPILLVAVIVVVVRSKELKRSIVVPLMLILCLIFTLSLTLSCRFTR